ncbi:MAG: DUF4384 domain-containing protein [Janthinobacterium lividum]
MRVRETTRATAKMVARNGYGEQPHLVRTTPQTQQFGLRYSLLLRGTDGSYKEASPDTTFHSGDLVRLSVMSNEPGYLYVIQQGSSGYWSSMFPIPNAVADSNRVEPGRLYQLPGGNHSFEVTAQPGQEKLFVILSKEPISDLDAAIQRLRQPPTPPSVESSPALEREQVLEANNQIPDSLVQRLVSRDLVLVTEQKIEAAPKTKESGEKAVYVVAKQDTQRPTHEVVTRITLNHR